MARFFVNRPIVAMVMSIIIVLLGVVAMQRLPVAQYPEIVPPMVQVTTTFIGASATDVESSVATPLEQQINGVENGIYMKSTNANDGTLTLKVSFEVGSNLDMNNVLTQNRVNQAMPQMPQAVKNYGVSVKKALAFPLLIISIKSPHGTYDNNFLSNYATINVNDAIARIPGVGQINLFGGSDYAMRIWLRPDQIGRLGITIPDIANAIGQQNQLLPSGQIGGPPAASGTQYTYTVRTKGRLLNEDEFGDIILRTLPDGSQVRLKDVARIELGTMLYNAVGRHDGKPAAVIAVFQIPGTNALQVANEIKSTMADLSKRFPRDMEYVISLDTTLPVSEGIKEIVHTLFEAVVLVIIVVFVFLQNWRATLIPLMTVPVSLVGAFVFFPLLGFSINVLSLLGLVLAIGIVVDDAIVVVEAVMHHIEHGMAPKEATLKAMEEVSGPVVAIGLILSAVFVPVGFMGGITGRLYQQFAITIALSVLLSVLNALTLSPALSALLLKPASGKRTLLTPFYNWFNRIFGRTTDAYVSFTGILVGKMLRSMAFVGVLVYVTVVLVRHVPTGFIPEEDQGYLLVNVLLPDAASLERTDAVMRKAEAVLARNHDVAGFNTISGYSLLTSAYSSNIGFFFVELKPWHERHGTEAAAPGVIQALNKEFAQQIREASVVAFGPPAIPGLGTGAGFTIELQDRSGGPPEYLAQQTQRFIDAARKRPEIGRISTLYRATVPQIYADIDRTKVLKVGVPFDDVNTTLGALLGSSYVNDFNKFGRVYKVYLQAEPQFRQDPRQLGLFFVRNRDGGMVPLDTLLTTKPSAGPEFTNRFNLFRAAELTGVPAAGYSSAQALDALEDVARDVLPSDMTHDWADMSYQERKAPGVALTFMLAVFLVFLILAAQYESWGLPFSVLLGTPFAAFGAYLGLWLARQMSPSYVNNVFAQIGLIMLIGLAAKNAILIVEFAKVEHDSGKPLVESALSAARLRFRPILMTAFAFILGVVPLLTASGAGAEARKVMGMAVFSGMLIATIIGVCLIPVLFVLVERVMNRRVAILRTATAMLAMFIAGCAPVGPKYQRPPVVTPPQFRFVETSEAASLADLRWWQVFEDPTLQALIREAIANNLDLRAAAARVERFRAEAGIAKSFLYPQVDAAAAYTVQQNSGTNDGDVQQNAVYGFQLSWELDLFGRIRREHEAAVARMLASEQGRRGVLVTLVADVASTYFLLRELDVQLDIARRTLGVSNETVTFFENRLNGGVSNQLEVDRVRAFRTEAAAAIPDLERQIAVAENAISLLIGRPPAPVERERLDTLPPPPPLIPPGLPAALLERRPDVVEAEQLLVAANANVGAAKALFFPAISLTSFLGGISGGLSTLLGGSGAVWQAAPSLLQPVFTGGRLRNNLEATRASYDEAVAQYEKAALNGYREVANALITVQKLADIFTEQQTGVASLRSAADLSRARFNNGLASYIEILTADQDLFEQQLQLAQTAGSELRARAELYRALGGGWQP